MKILALDISSVSTGYCVINDGRLLKSSLGTIATESKDNISKRLHIFRNAIIDLIEKHNPDKVICEDIFRGRNILTFKVLACFRGVALEVIYEKTGTYPISVMASEARKLVGVKNTKEDCFDYVMDKYTLPGFNFDEHNDIADSIILGLAAHTMEKNGINEKSLRSPRRKKRRKRKRN